MNPVNLGNSVTSMIVLLAMFVTSVLKMKIMCHVTAHQTLFAMELVRKDFILAKRMVLTAVRNVPTVALITKMRRSLSAKNKALLNPNSIVPLDLTKIVLIHHHMHQQEPNMDQILQMINCHKQ